MNDNNLMSSCRGLSVKSWVHLTQTEEIRRRVVYSFDINTNRKWFEHLKHRSRKQSKTVTGGENIVNTLLRFLILKVDSHLDQLIRITCH